MFINPNEVIKNGWITGITDPASQIQPNAIDFTLDELFRVNSDEVAIITKNKKLTKMRSLLPVPEVGDRWKLLGNMVYDGTSLMYVKVPAGYACVPLFTRSTLTRNGIFLMSGVYDSGFEGHIGFTIYTDGGPVEFEKGVRVGQIGFVKSENAHLYAGDYNHEQGTHYTERQKISIVPLGQKQIPSNPARTESGMGPILDTNSDFL